MKKYLNSFLGIIAILATAVAIGFLAHAYKVLFLWGWNLL